MFYGRINISNIRYSYQQVLSKIYGMQQIAMIEVRFRETR